MLCVLLNLCFKNKTISIFFPSKILKFVETEIIKIKTFDAICVSGNDYKILI